MKPLSVSAVRASISFPADLYEKLEALAKRKKVSLAWVVRDAAEQYVEAEDAAGAGTPDPKSRGTAQGGQDKGLRDA